MHMQQILHAKNTHWPRTQRNKARGMTEAAPMNWRTSNEENSKLSLQPEVEVRRWKKNADIAEMAGGSGSALYGPYSSTERFGHGCGNERSGEVGVSATPEDTENGSEGLNRRLKGGREKKAMKN